MKAVIRGINKAYDQKETRPFWMVRLISLVAVIILAFTVIFSLALLLFGETAEKELFYHFRFPISTGGLYDRQVSLTCNLDVLCVHPALHADTQPAAFFKRGSARFRIFGSKLDIGHHTLFIIYKQLCGLFQNVRKHRRIIALLVWLYWISIIIMLGGELNASLAQKKE